MLESEVTRDCVRYLEIKGATPYRRNVGLEKKTYKGKTRYIRYGIPGQCDWWMILPDGSGKHIDMEFKSSVGWPTNKQILWMIDINMQKGVAFWVNSLSLMETLFAHVMSGGRVEMEPDGRYRLIRTCE